MNSADRFTQNNNDIRVQTVVFVRHGVAKHNYHGADLMSQFLLDPPLVSQGKLGAIESGQKIKLYFLSRNKSPQLVLCSPLTRCLQTALLAFLPGEIYDDDDDENKQKATAPPPKILCVEQVREAFGMHYPDQRRPKSVLKAAWQRTGIEFDSNMTERDELWKATKRESYDGVKGRVRAFLDWLCQRPESNVVVVSHGVWIETMLLMYQPHVLQNGQRRVHNGEAFSTQLVSRTMTSTAALAGTTEFLELREAHVIKEQCLKLAKSKELFLAFFSGTITR